MRMAGGCGRCSTRDAPKRYSCACGHEQDSRRSKFAGKCRHCNTRPKYLMRHSSLDADASPSPCSGPPPPPVNRSRTSSASHRHHNRHNSSPPCTLVAEQTTVAAFDNHCTTPGENYDRGSGTVSSGEASSGGMEAAEGGEEEAEPEEEALPPMTRRRSRSMDHYDSFSSEPPPYSFVAGEGWATGRRRNRGDTMRRTESDDRFCTRWRRESNTTLPPPYDPPPDQLPPSYEEALATSERHSTNHHLSASPIIQSMRAADSSILMLPPSAVLHEQSVLLEARRQAVQQGEEDRIRREAQIAEDHERDMELEAEHLRRNLQIAQYCGCNKCQNLYYSYYYGGDPVTEATPFPIEQVLMQEVLTDGLAFCSLM